MKTPHWKATHIGSPLSLLHAMSASLPHPRSDRRSFLKIVGFGGAALGASATLAACDTADPVREGDVVLDFATDGGVLNYALVLEQLEAAFYAAVVGSGAFSTTFNADEQQLLRDLGAHEAIHRDFLRAVLGNDAIHELTFDFSGIDLTNRSQVLETALAFEDLGVAAYNGAGRYLRNAGLLTLAGKIVSVEARHAAEVASVIAGTGTGSGRFGGQGVIDANGLDLAFPPPVVIGAAADIIADRITIRNA